MGCRVFSGVAHGAKLRAVVAFGMLAMGVGCHGSFALFNKVQAWNGTLGDKWINSVVHAALWVVPAYELILLGDLVVFNSIEFWSGKNPVLQTAMVDASGTTIKVAIDGRVYEIEHSAPDVLSLYEGQSKVAVFSKNPAGDWEMFATPLSQTTTLSAATVAQLSEAVARR